MNEITYGPYDRVTWKTMLMLKKSILWYKDQNTTKYTIALRKEQSLLKDFIKGIL